MNRSLLKSFLLIVCTNTVLGLGWAAPLKPFASVAEAPAPSVPKALVSPEEFNGPFLGWENVKTDFGAVGDGKTDDTAAIVKAFAALPAYGKGKATDPQVIYFPAGTYRITESLNLENRMGIQVMGEDPATTTILYDGPAGQPILHCNGVSYSKFGRITWNGNGKASACVAHQWVPKSGFPPGTYMLHVDEVFENAGKGLLGGYAAPVLNDQGQIVGYDHGMDAETLVKRCQFINDDYGVSIESFNALDWWIWDSRFDHCGVGATNCALNSYGGGHFHIYRSLFQGSKEADIRTGHTSYFGIRLNTSVGSRRFLETFRPTGFGENNKWGKWSDEDQFGSVHSVQGNHIIDSTDPTPIWINQHGPLILLDNTFVSKPLGDAPLVLMAPPTDGAACVSIGNHFYGNSTVTVKGTLTQQDNVTSSYEAAGPADRSIPELVPTAPQIKRTVFALTPSATADDIQSAINQAAKQSGQHPVVYLPWGRYNIGKTLFIPANTDLQLVGDGINTVLTWSGTPGGTMMHVEGPTHATLRDFEISGIWNPNQKKLGNGLVVENIDQPGGQIIMDQVDTSDCDTLGMAFEGLKSTRVVARGLGSGGISAGPGIVVDAKGVKDTPSVGLFGSAGGNNLETHVVKNGGNLVVWDTWYETAVSAPDSAPTYIHLTDSGNLTYFAGNIATFPGKDSAPNQFMVDLDGFKGTCALIGAGMTSRNPQVRLAGSGDNMKFLMLGSNFDPVDPYFQNSAKNVRAAVVACRQSTDKGGYLPVSPLPAPSPEMLRDLLQQARTTMPTYAQPAPANATDLRMDRVMISYQIGEGLVVRAGDAPPTP